VKSIEWTEAALEDLAGVDKTTGKRIKLAVERFAESEMGHVKKLQGISPSEYRLRMGDWRIRFTTNGNIIQILRVLNRKEAYR
jgi:mRNA-degrading endonuclease RelE of RelBE toxin-antitoxin system